MSPQNSLLCLAITLSLPSNYPTPIKSLVVRYQFFYIYYTHYIMYYHL